MFEDYETAYGDDPEFRDLIKKARDMRIEAHVENSLASLMDLIDAVRAVEKAAAKRRLMEDAERTRK